MDDEEDGNQDDDNTVTGAPSKTTRLKYVDQLVCQLPVILNEADFLLQRKIAQREQDLLIIDLEDLRIVRSLHRRPSSIHIFAVPKYHRRPR